MSNDKSLLVASKTMTWIVVKGIVTESHRRQVMLRFSNAVVKRQGVNYVALQFDNPYQAEVAASVHSGLRFDDGLPFGVELVSDADPLVRQTLHNIFGASPSASLTPSDQGTIYQSLAPPRQPLIWESVCRWVLSID